ncbi:MAG TPA: nitrile hydratase subunit beta [Acidimicrobiales bacterium]
MDGVHDLGGMQGFGAVVVEPGEPVFHEQWERRAAVITFGSFLAGASNGGQFRHSIERMDPSHYLDSTYYEHWLTGVATRLVEAGLITRDDLEERTGGPFPLSRPDRGMRVDDPGADVTEARFAVGDQVRVRNWHPPGHTRCPRYVRGHKGTIVRIDIVASVPDIEAHSPSSRNEPTYSVRFEAAELWGEPGDPVHVDLWDNYLEPTDER